jgi:hypothetical protein
VELAAGASSVVALGIRAPRRVVSGRAAVDVHLGEVVHTVHLDVLGIRAPDGPRATGGIRVGVLAGERSAAEGEVTLKGGESVQFSGSARARIDEEGAEGTATFGVRGPLGAATFGWGSSSPSSLGVRAERAPYAEASIGRRAGVSGALRGGHDPAGRAEAWLAGWGGTASVGALVTSEGVSPRLAVEHEMGRAELLTNLTGRPIATQGALGVRAWGRAHLDWRWVGTGGHVPAEASSRIELGWRGPAGRIQPALALRQESADGVQRSARLGLRVHGSDADLSAQARWAFQGAPLAEVALTGSLRGESVRLDLAASATREEATRGIASATARWTGEHTSVAVGGEATFAERTGGAGRVAVDAHGARGRIGGELEISDEGARMAAHGQVRDRRGRSFGVEVAWERDADVNAVSARLTASAPLAIDLPGGDGVVVRGRVAIEGQGLAGVAVRLGDHVVATRSDGTFEARVDSDEVIFDLVGGVPAGRIPGSALPREVTLRDDEGPWLDVELVAPARVEVAANWRKEGLTFGETPSLEGMLVTLTAGDERLRRVLDGAGRAAFDGVRPGSWSVEFDARGRLPDGARVDAPVVLDVTSGAPVTLEAIVRTRAPTLRLVEIPG